MSSSTITKTISESKTMTKTTTTTTKTPIIEPPRDNNIDPCASSSADIGHFRLQKVLNQLDDMASYPSPRSPLLHQSLYSPSVKFLPTTRFPTDDPQLEQIHEITLEIEKERENIHNQPYRTTQLIMPGAKPRPDLVNNKLTGKPLKPTVYRPLDQKSVVATLDENRALVNRQFNSPRSLYSQQNVADAVYEQTGVSLRNSANAPIHRKPATLKEFNPELSPTFQALLEQESGYQQPQLLPAPHIQQSKPPPRTNVYAAPNQQLNSVGQPTSRIAQSGSFRRLMIAVLGE